MPVELNVTFSHRSTQNTTFSIEDGRGVSLTEKVWNRNQLSNPVILFPLQSVSFYAPFKITLYPSEFMFLLNLNFPYVGHRELFPSAARWYGFCGVHGTSFNRSWCHAPSSNCRMAWRQHKFRNESEIGNQTLCPGETTGLTPVEHENERSEPCPRKPMPTLVLNPVGAVRDRLGMPRHDSREFFSLKYLDLYA